MRRVSEYQQLYDQCIANGCTPAMADMLASRQAPVGKTNDTYRNNTRLEKQFDNCPEVGDELVWQTRRHDPNFNPKGKIHIGGLVRKEVGVGDPQAWVSASDPLGEIKQRCKEQGRTVSGDVNYTAPERDLIPEKYKVNDKIVERVARNIKASKPKMKMGEAREAARDQVTPKSFVGEGKVVE